MSFLFQQPAYSRPNADGQKAATDAAYSFECEYFDSQAALVRRYQLTFFLADSTIELFDLKSRKLFLKRCNYPAIQAKDLFIGSQVTIYARQLKILAYADSFTESRLAVEKGKSLAVLTPAAYEKLGENIEKLNQAGLRVARGKIIVLSESEARAVAEVQIGTDVAQLTRGPTAILEVVGKMADEEIERLSKSTVGLSAAPQILSAALNTGGRSTATFSGCTVALIKPHAVSSGLSGPLIQAILDGGWEISALECFNLDRQAAEEYLEIYRSVVPEYHALVEQLTAGTCVAMEIRGSQEDSPNIVNLFRDFTGPSDPEIARQLRPDSLRAKFGVNKVKNAIHVTDLEDDGVLEAQFFFEILQNAGK